MKGRGYLVAGERSSRDRDSGRGASVNIFDDGALLARLQLAYRCAPVRRVRVQSRELWHKAEGADLAAVAYLHADADDGAEPNGDVVAEPNGRGLDDAVFHGVSRQMHAVADHDAVAWRSGILTGGAR